MDNRFGSRFRVERTLLSAAFDSDFDLAFAQDSSHQQSISTQGPNRSKSSSCVTSTVTRGPQQARFWLAGVEAGEAPTSGGALGVGQLSFLSLPIPRDWIGAGEISAVANGNQDSPE